jgi:ribonuclease J
VTPSAGTRIVFLGGLGEIGRNMIAVEAEGKILVIDAGLSFPTDEMYGVDLVLPDFTFVTERARDCAGIILTHGHEDHVGGLSWLLKEVEAPVHGTSLTLGIARRRLDEWGVEADFREIGAPGTLALGPFELEFLAVSHSIPDAVAVAIGTRDGRIVYTGDFKLDPDPIDGRRTDLEGFRRLGDAGVDLLLSDSTNCETPGRTPSEAVLGEPLAEIFSAARRRVIVACFASNLHRIQQVCEICERAGRKVAFVGRSMISNLEVGRELGHVKVSDETLIDIDDIESWVPEETAIVCTGSQGEPLSALSLIATGEHKSVTVTPGDTVILSASPIPGNESAVHRVLNGLYRAGADVYHSETHTVHVSGHAAADELAEMLDTVRPRHFVPVHGEYRHLAIHARIGESKGMNSERVFVVEDGDTVVLRDGKVRHGDRVPAGLVLVDGLGVGDVGPVVLRDRHHLAEDGVLICVVTIDAQNGDILAGPDLISRGFVHIEEARDFLDDAADRVAEALEDMQPELVTDWGAIKKVCRRTLGEFVWQETRRRPMILPIIMEV